MNSKIPKLKPKGRTNC